MAQRSISRRFRRPAIVAVVVLLAVIAITAYYWRAISPPEIVTRRIAFIIDDLGYDPLPLEAIIALGHPLTVAVLPYCPHSAELAEKAHRAGLEVMLHLPMEPLDYPKKNPGDGALFTGMTNGDIRWQVAADLAAVPHAAGVNNHMGSRFMEDRIKVKETFGVLKDRGLFFIDSCTTSHSQGKSVADELDIPFAARDIFIDNDENLAKTFQILTSVIDKRNWRSLIMIGHPHDTTIKALGEALPFFKRAGIAVVPVSALISCEEHQ
ncbi:MAG: divergent polysaccharide deacetylase family protein [Deltaproteobacteria bacterium]|nr:divergent polysaccharide deacetylase family protein [Deltaproteobacteria bacterium]